MAALDWLSFECHSNNVCSLQSATIALTEVRFFKVFGDVFSQKRTLFEDKLEKTSKLSLFATFVDGILFSNLNGSSTKSQ